MAVTINASTSAGLVQTADTSGVLALQTAGTTAVSVSASQVVTLTNALPVASGGTGVTTSTGTGENVLGTTPSFTSTIGVGGATASASGSGITFPATQSASTDANTLDDYEEGTWTPSIAFGGGTTGITYNHQVALYTKIGRMVHVSGYIALSSKGSSTGTATLINFPFSSINIANQYLSAMQGWYILLATGQGIIFDMAPNNNLVTLKYPSATSVSTHTDTTFNNNTGFEFSFVYSA